MMEVGIRALKQNASAVVAQVAAGETVTVTDRGRPVALLTPIPTSTLASMIASGHARPARRSITELSPALPGPPVSLALQSQREAERY